ncbi:MAG TPA: hypothetical protein VL181_11160 [Holophagaceae bacterium]|nr:hypothetical protein [Holophagaceae bacterium]
MSKCWVVPICFAASVLCAGIGSTTVHYKDGKTYAVETLAGWPVAYHDDDIQSLKIRPFIKRPADGKPLELCWAAKVYCQGDETLFVEIEPDSFPKDTLRTLMSRYATHFFGLQSQAPELWTWVDAKGDSWIPFRISYSRIDPKARAVVIPADSKDRTTFVQWVRLTESDRESLLSELKRLNEQDKGTLMQITDLRGVPHEIRAIKGYPAPWWTPEFSIKNLAPSVAKGTGGQPVFAWALDAYFPEKKSADLTISLTDFPDLPPQKAHLTDVKAFRFISADSVHFPDVWKWVQSSGDTWLHFAIKVDEGPDGIQEGEQWVLIAEKDKKRMKEILKAEGYR